MPKIKYGKITFSSKLAKDHWIIQGNIHGLKAIIKLGTKNLTATQSDLIKLSIKQLSALERRMKKQLIKDGYITK